MIISLFLWHLTLTSVVFELFFIVPSKLKAFYLTLTSVVFESLFLYSPFIGIFLI